MNMDQVQKQTLQTIVCLFNEQILLIVNLFKFNLDKNSQKRLDKNQKQYKSDIDELRLNADK